MGGDNLTGELTDDSPTRLPNAKTVAPVVTDRFGLPRSKTSLCVVDRRSCVCVVTDVTVVSVCTRERLGDTGDGFSAKGRGRSPPTVRLRVARGGRWFRGEVRGGRTGGSDTSWASSSALIGVPPWTQADCQSSITAPLRHSSGGSKEDDTLIRISAGGGRGSVSSACCCCCCSEEEANLLAESRLMDETDEGAVEDAISCSSSSKGLSSVMVYAALFSIVVFSIGGSTILERDCPEALIPESVREINRFEYCASVVSSVCVRARVRKEAKGRRDSCSRTSLFVVRSSQDSMMMLLSSSTIIDTEESSSLLNE